MIGSRELRSNNSTIFAEIFYIGIVLHTGLTPVFPFNFCWIEKQIGWSTFSSILFGNLVSMDLNPVLDSWKEKEENFLE